MGRVRRDYIARDGLIRIWACCFQRPLSSIPEDLGIIPGTVEPGRVVLGSHRTEINLRPLSTGMSYFTKLHHCPSILILK